MDDQIQTTPQDSDGGAKPDASDNLTPEHPRFKEVIAEKNELKKQVDGLQSQLEEIQQSIKERQERTGNEEYTSEEQAALEKIDRGLRAKGYITKAEMEEEKKVERMALQFERLSEKHDGSDGLPKFVASEVATYAKAQGIENLEAAYKVMHMDAFVQKARGSSIDVPQSEKPTAGDKGSTGTKVAPEDIAKMSPAEYEKHRENLLASIRPKN